MPTVLDDVCFNKASIIPGHAYQSLNLSIVKAIMNNDWIVFVTFARELGMKIDPHKEGT